MQPNPSLSHADLSSPLEIVISRLLTAPRKLVWQAWTNPAHAENWWGPAGFSTTTHSHSLTPGGSWKYTMHGPDGRNYPNHIIFEDILEPSRLVYRHAGTVDSEPVNFRTHVTFDPAGPNDSHTLLTMRSRFDSEAARNHVIQTYNAVEGGKQHLANLDAFLSPPSPTSATTSPDSPSEILTISRHFSAPREQIWQAWTHRDHLARWFGPKGASINQATLDLRPAGLFHYSMSNPQGLHMWGRWIFCAIDPLFRLTFISSFSNEQAQLTPAPFPGLDDFPPQVLGSMTLLDHAGPSKGTLLTLESRPFDATPAQRAFFANFHKSMQQGWSGTLDQLTDHLQHQQ
jgi:uncharacterized protein YndB with AHSA1/START domain